MKRQITQSIINSLKNLKQSLSPKLFSENLKLQLKQYEINLDFLMEFSDNLDTTDISKCSLTPECIKYLCNENKFDYDIWKKNIFYKNIDILVDDEFIKKYNVNIEEILSQSKIISAKVYNKYANSANSNIRKNLLLNYNGPEVDIQTILNNLELLQTDIFKIEKIVNDIKAHSTTVQNYILHTTKMINPLVPIYLMQLVYIPKEADEYLDQLNYTKLINNNENEEDTKTMISMAQNVLKDIIEKYPVKIIDKILEILYYSGFEVLANRTLLMHLLAECDNLSESVLIDIHSVFITTGLRDSLLTYAKNYQYLSLIALLAL